MSNAYRSGRRGMPRGGDRRREPRVSARLEAYLVVDPRFLDADADPDKIAPLELYGYASDLSPSGMGLVIPAINFDPRPCSGLPLKIRLVLAAEWAEVEAEAVYCIPLDELKPLKGVRLGTKLRALDESARAFIRSSLQT